MATEMASPIASDTARNAACFHGDKLCRMSSAMRPKRGAVRAGEAVDRSPLLCATMSCMTDHGTADGLAVRGPLEFGHDAAPCHDTDAIRQIENFIEVFADEHDGRAMFTRRQQTL